jgi:hypothetical protein
VFEQFRRIFKQHIVKDRKDYLTLALQFAVGMQTDETMFIHRLFYVYLLIWLFC